MKYNLYIWLHRNPGLNNELFQVQMPNVSMTCIFNTIRFYRKNYRIEQVTIKECL